MGRLGAIRHASGASAATLILQYDVGLVHSLPP